MNRRDERIARWRERGAQDGIKAEQRRTKRAGLEAVEAGRHVLTIAGQEWLKEDRQ